MRNVLPWLLILACFLITSADVYSAEVNLTSNIELMTEKEKQALISINNKYNYDIRYRELNNEMSTHSARVWQYVNKTNDYDDLVDYLTQKVVEIEITEGNSAPIDDLITIINEKNRLEKELLTFQNLTSSFKEIKSKYSELNNEKKKANSEKLKLLDQIIKRINGDILSNNIIKGTYSGYTNCSKNDTIKSCLSQQRGIIEDLIRDSNLYLGKKSDFKHYEVVNASLDMKGRLAFDVIFSAVPTFSKKIYHQLNNTLGLNSILVELKSDVAAEWFVDGRSVGQGERIEVELSSGYHGIFAQYQGSTQSSVEDISKPVTLNYFLGKESGNQSVSAPSPVMQSDSGNTMTKFFIQQINTKDNDAYVLIVDEQGVPLISDWSRAVSICSNNQLGRIAKYEEYIDIITGNEEYNDLIKYRFNTLDLRTVLVQDNSYIKNSQSKGVTICKK